MSVETDAGSEIEFLFYKRRFAASLMMDSRPQHSN